MSDLLTRDNELIEKERERLRLPKPTEFEKGRLDPILVEKLLPLVQLPFDEKVIKERKQNGFKSKGVPYKLQINRLQQIFGISHILIEHKVISQGYKENSDPTKMGLYYFKVYVELRIGNWTMYNDTTNNRPDSSFVTYYKVTGVGFASAVDEGGAEKNAIRNGIKDALSEMGMLRYLYIDDDESGENGLNYQSVPNRTTVQLIEEPTFFDNGILYMKSKIKDLATEKEKEMIIYRENNYNPEPHREMISIIENFKETMKKGRILNIEYRVNVYKGNEQYIVSNILKK